MSARRRTHFLLPRQKKAGKKRRPTVCDESFNGRLRDDEFLNVDEFITMQDAREKLKAWQHDCNHHRPNGLLGHLTPSESSE